MTQPSEPMTLPPPAVGRRIRKRWGILALLVILALLLIGTHWIWTIGAGRRLNNQVAQFKSRGEPIEPGEFTPLGDIDGENAVPDLRAAAAAIDRTTELWTTFKDERDYPALPLRPKELETLRGIVAANATVFPLVDSATKKPGVDWGLVFKTPVINTMLPDLTPQRDLARLLEADALLAHTDGDHARSVQRAREILFQSRAVGRQPILVSHLVSVGLGALASDATQNMAQDLRIGTGQGEVPPRRVRELIAVLLDDTLPAESQRHALLGERMMQYDMVSAIAAGNVAPNAVMGAPPPPGRLTLLGRLIKPTVLDDGVLMTRHTTALMEAAQAAPNWPAFKAAAPQMPAEVREQQWKHLVAGMLMPSLDRAVQTQFRSQLDRRTAAVFLALRLYAVEHGGALPDSLEALVPNYLPSLPSDPFALTTQPLKYAGGADPIVYSVGENGTDDGGSEQEPTTAPSPFLSRPLRPSLGKWEKLDIVTHYERQPRPEPEPEPTEDGIDGFDPGAPTTGAGDGTIRAGAAP